VVGTRTGQEVIFNNAPNSPQTVTLTGTGVSSNVTPTSTPTPSSGGCTTGCNNYYVSPTGADSNSGTQASPWKTIGHADASFSLGSSGAVIHVLAGSYAGGLSINRGGSSSSVRLRIQCDNGVASAVAAIGQCKITGGGFGVGVTGNNVDLVGFDIGNDPNMIGCIFSFYTGSAVASTGGNSFHAIGNYCHDLGSNVSNAPSHIVDCPFNGAVQFNNQHGHTMTDQQGIGNIILNFGKGYPLPGCSSAEGLYALAPGTILENNIVINVPTGSIQIITACDAVVSNNTLISSNDGIILDDQDAATCPGGVPGHNTFDNNYVSNVGNTHFFYVGGRTFCTASTPNFFGSNVTDGIGSDKNATFTCDTFSPPSLAHVAGVNSFVNYQTGSLGDLHIKSGSSLINTGITQCVSGGISPCVPSTDFDGVSRPQGSAIDIGAYEQ
jgi:hypothetical protein